MKSSQLLKTAACIALFVFALCLVLEGLRFKESYSALDGSAERAEMNAIANNEIIVHRTTWEETGPSETVTLVLAAASLTVSLVLFGAAKRMEEVAAPPAAAPTPNAD